MPGGRDATGYLQINKYADKYMQYQEKEDQKLMWWSKTLSVFFTFRSLTLALIDSNADII